MKQLNLILPNNGQLQLFLDLVGSYKTGSWIYPGVIKRKLNLSISDTYQILSLLDRNDFLESRYEMTCPNCQHTSGEICEVINQLPEFFYCEMCNTEQIVLESAMLIYKVVT